MALTKQTKAVINCDYLSKYLSKENSVSLANDT